MSEPKRPQCEDCGSNLTCRSCDDNRPTAEDVYVGWAILTPLGRWELIEQTKQKNEYAPVLIQTKESGRDFWWEYPRWEKVDARAPAPSTRGEPEVHVLLGQRGSLRMYAAASTSDVRWGWSTPKSASILVEAGDGGRGNGWWVRVAPAKSLADEPIKKGLTKAQARSEVTRHAKEFAKVLKIKARVVEYR